MISNALTKVRQRIELAAQQFARSSRRIQLLAVSKTRPVGDIVTEIGRASCRERV